MALQHIDFTLTDEQVARINQYFQEQAQGYADAGEDAVDAVYVTFVWMPGIGRSVTAHFNGDVAGCDIELL